MKNICILGGAGFVGSNLAFFFAERGYKVTVIDNLVRRGVENNLPIFKKKGISFFHGDIRNKEDLVNIPEHCTILHCAAQPSAINYENPEFDLTNNLAGVINVLEHCRKTKNPIIFWSTNKVYPAVHTNSQSKFIVGSRLKWHNDRELVNEFWDPMYGFNENTPISGKDHSIYGASKAAADILVQEYSDAFNFGAIINRFSCLSGPNQWGKAEQGWMAWFVIAKHLNLPIDIYGFDGNQVRDYLLVEDLCELIHKQIEQMDFIPRASVYNVGGGNQFNISINEMIDFLGRKNFKHIVNHPATRRADQAIYISDIAKVCQHFDWKPKLDIKVYDKIDRWVIDNKSTLERMYS